MDDSFVHSGMPALDEVVQGLRLGDNVVWQVGGWEDYRYFAEPFADQGISSGRDVVYLRFAPQDPVLEPRPGLTIIEVDPSLGFDHFSREVHRIIKERGRGVFYIFDSLSSLVEDWATDELLANLFQVTCPYLFEFDTITYFALTRGQHAHSAVARIRDTTQLLIDVYHAKGEMYVHPVKVWDRYSPQMFVPHLVAADSWSPVLQSAHAAEVSAAAHRRALLGPVSSIAPWDSVHRKLVQYRHEGDDAPATEPELIALKHELCRMIIGQHPEFSDLADRCLTVGDLLQIRDRLIGSGQIGGKAAGMLVARSMLLSPEPDDAVDFSEVLEGHDSFYVGSDVFFTFLVHNDLFRLRLQLSENLQLSWDEFAEVEERFVRGTFPPEIMAQFRDMLDYFGQAPIIVRSSSLLEDSFGSAFAGKYRSEFCANQGDPEDRMEAFLRALRLVYASALNPDALSYRRKRGLGESDEQMAILVQRVSGMRHRSLFFPALAGVAFSHNLYVWSNRLDPTRGVIRLVFGLGTRAVERVGSDYPRMIAVSHPGLRPEVGAKIAKYSQRQVDLLDLEANELVTLPLTTVLEGSDHPNLHLLISVIDEGFVSDPVSRYIKDPPDRFVLTFNNLIRRTDFVPVMDAMLAKLQKSYGRPVDTEFTASVDSRGRLRVNLLQCRSLLLPGVSAAREVEVAREQVLFRSTRMIGGGVVRDIHYLVYIDPRRYGAIRDQEIKRSLGRVVGRINGHPLIREGKVAMVGPGRWGSSSIDLGVGVGYADIDNAVVLVEIAREEAGHLPELSYGTHFFQDLVESGIIYLAVFPDESTSDFNESFLADSPNALLGLLPDAGPFADVVQVIDVPAAANGAHLQVVADSQAQSAVCFLDK